MEKFVLIVGPIKKIFQKRKRNLFEKEQAFFAVIYD